MWKNSYPFALPEVGVLCKKSRSANGMFWKRVPSGLEVAGTRGVNKRVRILSRKRRILQRSRENGRRTGALFVCAKTVSFSHCMLS